MYTNFEKFPSSFSPLSLSLLSNLSIGLIFQEVPNPVMPPPRRFSAAPLLDCPRRHHSSSHSSSSHHHTYSIDSSESLITVIPARPGDTNPFQSATTSANQPLGQPHSSGQQRQHSRPLASNNSFDLNELNELDCLSPPRSLLTTPCSPLSPTTRNGSDNNETRSPNSPTGDNSSNIPINNNAITSAVVEMAVKQSKSESIVQQDNNNNDNNKQPFSPRAQMSMGPSSSSSYRPTNNNRLSSDLILFSDTMAIADEDEERDDLDLELALEMEADIDLNLTTNTNTSDENGEQDDELKSEHLDMESNEIQLADDTCGQTITREKDNQHSHHHLGACKKTNRRGENDDNNRTRKDKMSGSDRDRLNRYQNDHDENGSSRNDYYHTKRKLEEFISQVRCLAILETYYSKPDTSWCIIVEKVHPH